MKSGSGRWAVGLIAGVWLAPSVVRASPSQVILHKVSGHGETYEGLADRYYGARYLAHHLSAANRYQEPLKPGVTLIIPTYRRVPLKDPNRLPDFARRHLSRASRATYLRTLHGPRRIAKQNARVIVPPVLRHRVRPGETLKAIALTYYRDASARRRELIRLYNELPTEKLRARAVLRIPLDTPIFAHERVFARSQRRVVAVDTPSLGAAQSPSEPVVATDSPENSTRPSSKAPSATGSSPQPEVRKAQWTARVEEVERLYSDGHYTVSLNRAERALPEAGSAPKWVRTQLLSLAASSLIALGRPAEAERRLRTLLTLEPSYEPDAYRTSPKILDVFEAARRSLEAKVKE